MNGTIEIIFYCNLAGSLLAAAINLAACRMTPKPWKWLYGTIAGLALVYAASFVWVISGQTSIRAWSETMRWVALLAWVNVWSAPACVRLHFGSRQEADLVARTIARIDAVAIHDDTEVEKVAV